MELTVASLRLPENVRLILDMFFCNIDMIDWYFFLIHHHHRQLSTVNPLWSQVKILIFQ